jgi:hypothetical protein
MNDNLVRWVFQSIAKHFQPIAVSLSLPYFVEGIDERSVETMQTNHVELRVSGPSIKEPSNGYYNVRAWINFLFTKNMDMRGNAFDLDQWCGTFQDVMLAPVPIYKLGDGPDDTGQFVGCLRLRKNDTTRANVFHFGQIDKDTRVRQSIVDGEFEMDLVEGSV